MKKNLFTHDLVLKIMKISIVQFVIAICFMGLSFAHETSAQDMLNQRINIQLQSKTIKEILSKVEQIGKVRFTYSAEVIKANRITSLNAHNQTLRETIDVFFKPLNISYRIVDNRVILSPKLETVGLLKEEVQSTTALTELTITGSVTDDTGFGLPGVSILVKGTQQGTVSNENGEYVIQVPDENAILVFSYVGFLAQEHAVGKKNAINIVLKADSKTLEEVVVVGYGTSKKKDLTGSISNIKAENLASQAPRTVQDILRANAPGLNIGIATDAKAEASLSIRGQGTLTASNSPLIVLNNVIYEGALADINPADIASVDILKDASAAAVYGARSANGVIVITTKKGKKGKPVINFSSNTGIAVSANQPKILDENNFIKFRQDYNEGRNSETYLAKYPQIFQNPLELNGVNQLDWYNYDQKTPVTSVTEDQLKTQWLSRLNFSTPEMENYFAGKITKWDNLVFQKAFQQDYNVSVSNATDNISQYMSIGYTDRQGIISGDRYKNLRVRLNIETKITPFLTVGANSQFATRNEGFLSANWGQMTMISPYGSNNIDDPNSTYRRRPTGLDPINPFYDNLYTDRIDRRQNIMATLYSKIQLPFGIEYNINFTPYYNWYEYYNHYSSQGDNWAAIGGSSTRTTSKRFNWQMDNIFRWSKEFNKIHRVDLTFLVNAEKARLWGTTANASNYSPNDNLGYHAIHSGAVATVSSDDTYQTGDALMGRVFYSLKQRYMLTASVRRDGYSAFGKKNPRAIFPSIALGWAFTEEGFMNSVKWLNYGKLRLSWGENGNREIGQYAALSRMGSGLLPYIDQTGSVYSTSQIYVTSMANHNLKWERSSSLNLGLDFELFNSKLTGSMEVYSTRTNDLLVSRALPDITGYNSVMSNLGQMQNNGAELTLNSTILKAGDFTWNATANFSFNRRKINALYGDKINLLDAGGNVIGQKEANDEANGWFIGQDPDRIWTFERAGVWQLNEREEALKYGLQPGDFKYHDTNDDGIMDNKDKVFQGYKTPRYRWSLRNEAEYKGFRLSAMIYSNLGYYGAFQRAANNYSFPDRTSDYDFPRWTASNPINDYARIGSKNIGTNWVNKSFVRLENVTLSYVVPQKIVQKLSIQKLLVSASVQNAGVLTTHWNFWDPESGSVTPRTYNLGLNLTL
jgi:TonB-linked SusC/RagA family outer membrane protein